MSELKDKSVDTIGDMLFELSCNEDIDSNEFDIQFENEQGVTQWFSVNINELAGVSVTAIDKLTARNTELEAALEEIRSIVTDVQDGFEVTGSDAEILDLINGTFEDNS